MSSRTRIQPSSDSSRYTEVTWPDRIGILSASFRSQRFPKHWHDTVAIGVTESGAAETYYRRGVHVVRAGELMVVNAGEVHSGRALTDDLPWSYHMLYLRPEFVNRLASQWADRSVGAVRFQGPALSDLRIARAWQILARELIHPTADPLRVESLLVETFALLLQRYGDVNPDPSLSRQDGKLIDDVKEYLEAHIAGGGSLTELATLLGRSRFQLSRAFLRATGIPPYAWLEQRRVEVAASLLRDGRPISEVARATGFCDQSHLTRRFRGVYGVPPGVYAREVRVPAASEGHWRTRSTREAVI